MRKKTLYSLVFGALLGLATVLTIGVLAPQDACAGNGCGPWEQSPNQTVSSGSSCAEATNTLLTQLQSWAGCDGGFCESMLMITQPCQMNDPKWYPVTGYLDFQCRVPSGPTPGPGGDPPGDGGGTSCTPVCQCTNGPPDPALGCSTPGCRQVNCI